MKMGKRIKKQQNKKASWKWPSLRSLAIWVGGVFVAGWITNQCSGFYDTWTIAVKHASKGFWGLFIDIYYVSASTAELTDNASGIVMMYTFLFAVGFWIFIKFLDSEHRRLSRELDSVSRKDANPGKGDVMSELSALEKAAGQSLKNLKERATKMKKEIRGTKWLFGVTAVFMFYGLSLREISYDLVKTFRHAVVEVRPFITEAEYHRLNRQWVLMKSREDYRAIQKQIAEYKKRGESNGKSNE